MREVFVSVKKSPILKLQCPQEAVWTYSEQMASAGGFQPNVLRQSEKFAKKS